MLLMELWDWTSHADAFVINLGMLIAILVAAALPRSLLREWR